MKLHDSQKLIGFLLLVLATFYGWNPNSHAFAAGPRYWNVTPYRVQIDVIPVGTALSSPDNLASLVDRLQERCNTRLRPLWMSQVRPSRSKERLAFVDLLNEKIPTEGPPKETTDMEKVDKRILLLIEQQGSLLKIRCREYDTALKRWGIVHEEERARVANIEESLIEALTQTFSPLIAFEIDPKNPSLVSIQVRGSDLAAGNSFGNPPPDTILLPFLRRVDREGNPVPDGLSQVPWTYLVVPDLGPVSPDLANSDLAGNASGNTEPNAEEPGFESSEEPSSNKSTVADVYSHIRMPFGSRRRGRVEQLAIAVQHDPTLPTQLQLYAQQDESIPLEGYEVFIGKPGQGTDLTRLGRTDQTGSIVIPQSEDVLMAHVKSGSTVVASLPVAPGVNPLLRAPLLDERQRLAAESKLSAMREQLIDLVAQRQILQSRIRRRIDAEDLETAEKLLRKLESLPGQAQFSQQLEQAEQFYRADHPLVQRRLDRMFTQTRAVLGSSLDARETRKIAAEVNSALRQSNVPTE